MNKIQYQTTVRNMIAPKFRGKPSITAKVPPRYPISSEREYKRIAKDYMEILGEVLNEYQSRISSVVQSTAGEVRHDADKDDQQFDEVFEALKQAVKARYLTSSKAKKLRKELADIAEMSKSQAIREWKKVVKKTFGVDIFDDYYKGEKFGDYVSGWIQENVDLITTLPGKSLDRIRDSVKKSVVSGATTKSIAKVIQDTYQMDKSHALFVARDQIAKLNAQITQQQQKDAGVSRYKWSTSMDSRVRSRHRELHGKIFSWDNPPIVDEKTSRRCHPGEDYQCRCVAIPVFDLQTVDIPVSDANWSEIDQRMKEFNAKEAAERRRKAAEKKAKQKNKKKR